MCLVPLGNLISASITSSASVCGGDGAVVLSPQYGISPLLEKQENPTVAALVIQCV